MEAPWYYRQWRQAIATDPIYPAQQFSGRGLVFSAGGERHFTNLWVNLCLLRRILGCKLPIEVWHFGEGEMNPAMATLLEPFEVHVVNGESLACNVSRGRWCGFALKTLAVIHSRFQEVLFLDTDSHPVRDPSFLFEERAYRWAGSCFWPDIWRTDPASEFWRALDLPFVEEDEWESGQMVIDKSRCWRALSLMGHLNLHHLYYYQHVYGDKMTFYAAWKKLDQPYAMTRHAAKLVAAPDCRMQLNQFDFEGDLLFQHRTGSDWSLAPDAAQEGPGFVHQKACVEFLNELRKKWPATQRTCAAGAGETGGRSSPTPLQRLSAAGRRARPQIPLSPPAKPLTQAEQWKAVARQALRSPGIASPRLMGTAIDGLRDSDAQTARAIFALFVALIFIDPRLGAMLPGNLEIEGTELQDEWEALVNFKELAANLEGTTGLLPVRGNSIFPAMDAILKPAEQTLATLLGDILNDSWTIVGAAKGHVEVCHRAVTKPWRMKPRVDKVLVLTPLKNAADLAHTYCSLLAGLSYPPGLLSLGLLESDSTDGTYEAFEKEIALLNHRWRSVRIWKQDYHYSIPEGYHRWHVKLQFKRREILALSRNELLRRAMTDEDWVLWLDADVIEFPHDIIEQLLSYGKDILHPHCVNDYGGPTFDQNGWRERGRVRLEHLRGREILSPLDALGGTMLWIRADLHRKGLIFPPQPYGRDNPRIRLPNDSWDPENPGELETEGLGIMASDMNVQSWGLPDLEIIHRKK